jgi:hypothetical protein
MSKLPTQEEQPLTAYQVLDKVAKECGYIDAVDMICVNGAIDSVLIAMEVYALPQQDKEAVAEKDLVGKDLDTSKKDLKDLNTSSNNVASSVASQSLVRSGQYWEGFDFCCELIESLGYTKLSTHPFNIADCLKKKVNRLSGEPKRNHLASDNNSSSIVEPAKYYLAKHLFLPPNPEMMKQILAAMEEYAATNLSSVNPQIELDEIKIRLRLAASKLQIYWKEGGHEGVSPSSHQLLEIADQLKNGI